MQTQPLRSARDRGYRSKTPIRPEDRERTRSLSCCLLLLLLLLLIRNRLAELARTSKQLAGPPRRADNQPRQPIDVPVSLPDLQPEIRRAAREGCAGPAVTPEHAPARRTGLRWPLDVAKTMLPIQQSGRGS